MRIFKKLTFFLAIFCVLAVCSQHVYSGTSEEYIPPENPTLRHGVGEVLYGMFIELPKTTLDATLSGPPVVGTSVGFIAGIIQGAVKIIRGLGEVSKALSP